MVIHTRLHHCILCIVTQGVDNLLRVFGDLQISRTMDATLFQQLKNKLVCLEITFRFFALLYPFKLFLGLFMNAGIVGHCLLQVPARRIDKLVLNQSFSEFSWDCSPIPIAFSAWLDIWKFGRHKCTFRCTEKRLNASNFNDFNGIKILNGAQKRTRTSTALRPLAPEASASTNSAIWARKIVGRTNRFCLIQSQQHNA